MTNSNTKLVQCLKSFDTAFCRINAPAWINAPRLLTPTGYNSETMEPIWIIFSAHKVQVFGYTPADFHSNQTRLRVRFLPPHWVRLFGEIRYVLNVFFLISIPPALLSCMKYILTACVYGKISKKLGLQCPSLSLKDEYSLPKWRVTYRQSGKNYQFSVTQNLSFTTTQDSNQFS